MRDQHAQIYVMDVETKVITNLSNNPAANDAAGLVARAAPRSWSPGNASIRRTLWIMTEQGGPSKRFTRGGERLASRLGQPGSLILYDDRSAGVPRIVATTYESDGLIGNRVCPTGE